MNDNIDKINRLFKTAVGVAETSTSRAIFEEPFSTYTSVFPSHIWGYADKIPGWENPNDPNLEIIRQLKDFETYDITIDDATQMSLVRRHNKLDLTPIKGTQGKSYLIERPADRGGEGNIGSIISPLFGDSSTYMYELYRQDGSQIAYGNGDWLVDHGKGVITFYADLPDGVNEDLPPSFSCFQYIGQMGIPSSLLLGFDGVFLTGEDITILQNSLTAYPQDLIRSITKATNPISSNFIETYGWDGSDTEQGIGVYFEKVLPVRDHLTQDPIKVEIGLQEGSEVYSLLTDRVFEGVLNLRGYEVSHLSHGIPSDPNMTALRYEAATDALSLSVDRGESYGPVVSDVSALPVGAVFYVRASGSTSFIILKKTGNFPQTVDVTQWITVKTDTPSLHLFYWDSSIREFKPYIANRELHIDFLFPVVMRLGQIPPSVHLRAKGWGGFSSAVTSSFYGTRESSIVISSKFSSLNPEGADYIVLNTPGAMLSDIFNTIKENHPNFTGSILIRQGTYRVPTYLDLSFSGRVRILGERGAFLEGSGAGSQLRFIGSSDLEFRGFSFINAWVVQVKSGVDLADLRGDVTLEVSSEAPISVVGCELTQLEYNPLNNPQTLLNDPSMVDNSKFESVLLKGTDLTIRNSKIGTLESSKQSAHIWIDGCEILRLESLTDLVLITGSVIVKYSDLPVMVGEPPVPNHPNLWGDGSLLLDPDGEPLPNPDFNPDLAVFDPNKAYVSQKHRMDLGKFEVIDPEHFPSERKWIGFADPLYYDSAKEQIDLRINDDHLRIIDGVLTIVAGTQHIAFRGWRGRRPIQEEGTNILPITARNAEEALLDLYSTKADIDPRTGRVPISQLPPELVNRQSEVLKGDWSFEEFDEGAGGRFPLASEIDTGFDSSWEMYFSAASRLRYFSAIDFDTNEFLNAPELTAKERRRTIEQWETATSFRRDSRVRLLPGWYVIVKPSIVPNDPVHPQQAIDGVVYVQGDLSIYGGRNSIPSWGDVAVSYPTLEPLVLYKLLILNYPVELFDSVGEPIINITKEIPPNDELTQLLNRSIQITTRDLIRSRITFLDIEAEIPVVEDYQRLRAFIDTLSDERLQELGRSLGITSELDVVTTVDLADLVRYSVFPRDLASDIWLRIPKGGDIAVWGRLPSKPTLEDYWQQRGWFNLGYDTLVRSSDKLNQALRQLFEVTNDPDLTQAEVVSVRVRDLRDPYELSKKYIGVNLDSRGMVATKAPFKEIRFGVLNGYINGEIIGSVVMEGRDYSTKGIFEVTHHHPADIGRGAFGLIDLVMQSPDLLDMKNPHEFKVTQVFEEFGEESKRIELDLTTTGILVEHPLETNTVMTSAAWSFVPDGFSFLSGTERVASGIITLDQFSFRDYAYSKVREDILRIEIDGLMSPLEVSIDEIANYTTFLTSSSQTLTMNIYGFRIVTQAEQGKAHKNYEMRITLRSPHREQNFSIPLIFDNRLDSTSPVPSRVFGGEAVLFPEIDLNDGLGSPWDETIAMASPQGSGELELSNGAFRWPLFLGEELPGVVVDYSEYRWATFYLQSQDPSEYLLNNISNLTLELIGLEGDPDFNFNTEFLDISIGIKIGDSPWFDVNRIYRGVGLPRPMEGVLVVGTDKSLRRLTFGPQLLTGDAYVRIGLKIGSGITFQGVRCVV